VIGLHISHLLLTDAVVARARELVVCEPELAQAMATAEDLAAIARGRISIDYVRIACERYAERPCFGMRDVLEPAFRTITYRELWQRVVALATTCAERGLLAPGELVGICGGASVEWIVADLACLYRGAVSVPITVGTSEADAAHVLDESGLATLVCSAAEHSRLRSVIEARPRIRNVIVIEHELAALIAAGGVRAPVPPRSESEIDPDVMVLYSSGTTGRPKGIVLTERRWGGDLRAALAFPAVPWVNVGYLPLSHLAGRRLVNQNMMHGGVTYFTAAPDMSTLFHDVRLVRPTIMPAVPRISSLVSQHFLATLARRGLTTDLAAALDHPLGEVVMTEMRAAFFGDRLCLIRTGTAKTAPEVLALLERCFAVTVSNEYGLTETGSISVNGEIYPHLDYKLSPLPELGFTHPRGELLVKWPGLARGYLNNAEATAALFDPDGFVRTGDVVEELAPRRIEWIERKSSVARLAQGEFVNVDRLESLAATSSVIHQIYGHADPTSSYMLAVIVPVPGSSERATLRRELDRIARVAQLPRHEVPRDFVIASEPFSVANRLVTPVGKLDRAALKARYGTELAALRASIEARLLRGGQVPDADAATVVQRAAATALGLVATEVDPHDPVVGFLGFGGDSFSAIRFCALIEEAIGVAFPVAAVLDPIASFAALVVRVDELRRGGLRSVGYEEVHGTATEVAAAELALDRMLPVMATRAGVTSPPRVVLLTGGNGYLGRFVLSELLERLPRDGQLVCLVRGTGRLPTITDPRVIVHTADLARPRLGLEAPLFEALAERCDSIVHCGALVNHVLSYRELFVPNVLGTIEIARLAARRQIPIHFASTLGIVAGHGTRRVFEAESAGELHPRRSAAGTAAGYVTSKWASEVVLEQLHLRDGVTVQIYRCGMLLPHRRVDAINRTDNVNRLLAGILATGLAPRSFYAGEPARYDGLPVDCVATALVTNVLATAPGLHIFHASNAESRPSISLDHIVDWLETGGARLERLPHAEWLARFRARLEKLGEGARAWSPLSTIARWEQPIRAADVPAIDTRQFLALLGDRAPAIDEAYVHRWKHSLDGAANLV
jgi:fatty acid CoA ligase FadD9